MISNTGKEMKHINLITALILLILFSSSAYALPFYRNPDSLIYPIFRAVESIEYFITTTLDNNAISSLTLRNTERRIEEASASSNEVTSDNLLVEYRRGVSNLPSTQSTTLSTKYASTIQSIDSYVLDAYWSNIDTIIESNIDSVNSLTLPTDLSDIFLVRVVDSSNHIKYRICIELADGRVSIIDGSCIPSVSITIQESTAKRLIESRNVKSCTDAVLSGDISISPIEKVGEYLTYLSKYKKYDS